MAREGSSAIYIILYFCAPLIALWFCQPDLTPLARLSFLTFVLGAKFFHETNLKRKALALAAILVGVILLCV